MLLVGIGSAVAQQIVGIDAIQYFLMYIIEEAGIKDRTWQSIILIVLGILKVSVIVLAGHMFDSRGRRPLMFMSLIGKFFRDDCSISCTVRVPLQDSCSHL